MNETFPQFITYQNKKGFNFVELKELLNLVINLRASWNISSFKETTATNWEKYKGKLTDNQKIVFYSVIVKLRNFIRNYLQDNNVQFISKSVLLEYFDNEISKDLTIYARRQKIINSFVPPNPVE